MNKAAIKIQAVQRGKRDRKMCREKKENFLAEYLAATKIQKIYRGKKTRKSVKKQLTEKRKTPNLEAPRANKQSERMQALREAEKRGAEKREDEKTEAAAATKIQARFRGKQARADVQRRLATQKTAMFFLTPS